VTYILFNSISGRFQPSSVSSPKLYSLEAIEDSVEVFYRTTGGLFSQTRTFLVITPGSGEEPGRVNSYVLPYIPTQPAPPHLAEVIPIYRPQAKLFPFVSNNKTWFRILTTADDPGPEAA
jgi:hypothetical protein